MQTSRQISAPGVPTAETTGREAHISDRLGDVWTSLVHAVDAPLMEVTPLSGLGLPAVATAFRLRFGDGRILKARTFEEASRAAEVEQFLQHVDHPGFPKVMARSGKVLLTDWVVGRTFTATDATPERLRECGALQGLLHSIPAPAKALARQARIGHDWRRPLTAKLDALAAAGLLEGDEARRALAAAAHDAPNRCAVGFVHGDFCAENMILTPSGDLCIVDNEALTVAAYDYDLARTWYRWPMQRQEREAFFDGYHRHRSSAEFVEHFFHWAITAVVDGADHRRLVGSSAVGLPVAQLRTLVCNFERGIAGREAMWCAETTCGQG